jgi:hypothetical protein
MGGERDVMKMVRRSMNKRTGFGLVCFCAFFWFVLGFEASVFLDFSESDVLKTTDQGNTCTPDQPKPDPVLVPELALGARAHESLQMRGEDGSQIAHLPNSSIPFEGLTASFHDNSQVRNLFLYRAGKLFSARGWNDRGEPNSTFVDDGNGFVMELEDKEVGYIYDRGFEIAFRGRTDSGKLYRRAFADGTHVLYYPNGNMRQKTRHEEGKKDGLRQTWNEDGQLVMEFRDQKDETDGAIREWHDNGRIKKIMRLKNGKPDGTYVVYFETGKPFIEGSFSKGKRAGHWKRFYETGALKSSGSYGDGKRTGWHTLHREDGKTLKLFFHKGYLVY